MTDSGKNEPSEPEELKILGLFIILVCSILYYAVDWKSTSGLTDPWLLIGLLLIMGILLVDLGRSNA